MSGLKLKLRPEEQILINGAVVQNGKHQVELTVKTQNTRILRLRDAIHPNDANTPVKRVCYVAQMAVAGEVPDNQAFIEFIQGVTALQNVFTDSGSQNIMSSALRYAGEYDFYKAMQTMRKLIKYEEAIMMKLQLLENMQNTQTDITDESSSLLKKLHDKLIQEQSQKNIHDDGREYG